MNTLLPVPVLADTAVLLGETEATSDVAAALIGSARERKLNADSCSKSESRDGQPIFMKHHYVESTCLECGTSYQARRDDVARGRAKYCSKKCHAAGLVRYRKSISTGISKEERRRVYSQVARALSTGLIVKRPCEICDCKSVEAHHNDYSKPMEITWLCKLHHLLIHLG